MGLTFEADCGCAWLQVSAYTNGRSEVTMQDCLLLQHLMWQAPNEAERIAEWLLAQLAEGGDVRQCDYLLNSASPASRLCRNHNLSCASATAPATEQRHDWRLFGALPMLAAASIFRLIVHFVMSRWPAHRALGGVTPPAPPELHAPPCHCRPVQPSGEVDRQQVADDSHRRGGL